MNSKQIKEKRPIIEESNKCTDNEKEEEDEVCFVVSMILLVLLITFIVVTIYEITLLYIFYTSADEVECVLPLYCVFTTKRRESECYMNGEQVNCSESDFEAFEDVMKDD